jgi:hypothetical protein
MTPLRFHRLKLMGRSPAHYAAAVEAETTEAMETGTAADALLLTDRKVLAYPGKTRQGKEFDAFCEANKGALIVTKTELAKAQGIAEAVANCADAWRLLSGIKQQSLYWTFQGRECRGTPDVRGENFLTDLKTGETSDPRFFPWKVKRFAYHAQMAWYEMQPAQPHDRRELHRRGRASPAARRHRVPSHAESDRAGRAAVAALVRAASGLRSVGCVPALLAERRRPGPSRRC